MRGRRGFALASILLVSALTPGCASLFCIACDGALGADGHVYEWAEPPAGAESMVHVDSGSATPEGLIPVQGAEVVLEPWTPQKRPGAETVARLTHRGISDAAGVFRVGGTAKPGWFKATLSVRREGYKPAEHVFMHDRFRHQVVVILVRERSTSEGDR